MPWMFIINRSYERSRRATTALLTAAARARGHEVLVAGADANAVYGVDFSVDFSAPILDAPERRGAGEMS